MLFHRDAHLTQPAAQVGDSSNGMPSLQLQSLVPWTCTGLARVLVLLLLSVAVGSLVTSFAAKPDSQSSSDRSGLLLLRHAARFTPTAQPWCLSGACGAVGDVRASAALPRPTSAAHTGAPVDVHSVQPLVTRGTSGSADASAAVQREVAVGLRKQAATLSQQAAIPSGMQGSSVSAYAQGVQAARPYQKLAPSGSVQHSGSKHRRAAERNNSQAVEQPSTPKVAIATFLTDDTFAAGALTLAHLLRQQGCQLPLLVLSPSTAQLSPAVRQLLARAGWQMRRFEAITAPEGTKEKYVENFNKLALWQLTSFDVVLYLDADGLVARRMEPCIEAFRQAQRSCRQEQPPASQHSKQISRQGLLECNRRIAAAADLYWPGQVPRFNAGVLVLRPHWAMYNTLVAKVVTEEYDREYAEQALLNEVFNGSWARLPGECNLLVARETRDNVTFARDFPIVRYLHFASQQPRVMANNLVLGRDNSSVVATHSGEQATSSDALWVAAWAATRQWLRLPGDLVGNSH